MGKTIGIVGSRRRDLADDAYACDVAFAKILAKRNGLTITIRYSDWKLVASDRMGGTPRTPVKKAKKLGKKVIFV